MAKYSLCIRLCIVSCLVCSYSNLFSVVILIHGSFASSHAWWQPDGGFYKELEAQAKVLGHGVVPFQWSGTPVEKDIINAGKILAKLIQSYPATEPIIVIGHSHGGNVINYSSQLLEDKVTSLCNQMSHKPIDAVVAAATQQITAQHLSDANALTHYTSPTSAFCDVVATTKQGTLTTNNQKKYRITRVYLLGTPVDNKHFAPNMNVIGHLINLYSVGDYIQQVLGLYERRYHLHERLTNIEIEFKKDGMSITKPGHSALHGTLVGRWLLYIPDYLSKQGIGNFKQFTYAHNGRIMFEQEKEPWYDMLIPNH